jgi:hypothetical protein
MKYLLSFALIVFSSVVSFGQNNTKIKVSGNCGMCKKKIETAIANAGYDTEHQIASNEAYGKLDECCQYDRKKKKKS